MWVCSGDRWLTGCILVNTGPQLTWLDLHTDKHSDHLLHQLQQLHSLHELTITDFSFPGKCFANSLGHHADFSALTVCLSSLFHVCRAPWYCTPSLQADIDITLMLLPRQPAPLHCTLALQALTALQLNFAGRVFGEPSWVEEERTFSNSLMTLRELRCLTFQFMYGMSGDVMAAVLLMPRLEHLRFISFHVDWSATTIGLLSAKAAVQQPGLRITFEQREPLTMPSPYQDD
jgi:hypothetical protein